MALVESIPYSDAGFMAVTAPLSPEDDGRSDRHSPAETSSHPAAATDRLETPEQDADSLPEECHIPLPLTPIRSGTPIASEPSLETLRPKNDQACDSLTAVAIQDYGNEPEQMLDVDGKISGRQAMEGTNPLRAGEMSLPSGESEDSTHPELLGQRPDSDLMSYRRQNGGSLPELVSLWSDVHDQSLRKSSLGSRLTSLGRDLRGDREGLRLGYKALQILPACLGEENVQSAKRVLNEWFLWQKKRPAGYPRGRAEASVQQSWFEALNHADQITLLDVTNAIRVAPAFLAEKLCLLSPSEMNKLATPYEEPWKESSSTRASSSVRSGSSLFFDSWTGTPKRLPKSYAEFSGLLYTIVHDLFDVIGNLIGSDSQVRTQMLSEVIAQLMRLQTLEAQNLSCSILDLVSHTEQWPMKSKMSVLLQGFLQDGYNILHKDRNTHQDRSSPNTNNWAEKESFVYSAAHKVLNLIYDAQVTSCIPSITTEILLQQVHKAEDEFDADRILAALLEEWFISRFLVKAIAYPESFGMLTDVYIGTQMRSKILFSIAQKVKELMTPIRDRDDDGRQHWLVVRTKALADARLPHKTAMLRPSEAPVHAILGAKEAIQLLEILLPRRDSPPEVFSVFHPVVMRNVSKETASSTTTQDTQPIPTGFSVSTAASISGTSMTSLDHDPDGDEPIQHPPGDTEGPGTETPYQIDQAQLLRLKNSLETIVALDEFDTGLAVVSQDPIASLETTRDRPTRNFVLDASDMALLKEASENLLGRDPNAFRSNFDGQSRDLPNFLSDAVNMEKERMLDANDFTAAYYWDAVSHVLEQTHDLESIIDALFDDLSKRKVENSESIGHLQDNIAKLETQRMVCAKQIRSFTTQIDDLRAKLFYASDVRHSTIYMDAKMLLKALRDMHQETIPKSNTLSTWAKQRFRTITQSDDVKKAQLIERLVCPSRLARQKLTDDESEKTLQWLLVNNIEIFCADEEKIHRMHLEIKSIAHKLIRETSSQSPVLWSSELFQTEKSELISIKDQRAAWQNSLSPNTPNPKPGQSALGQKAGSYQPQSNVFGTAPRGLAIQTSILHPNDIRPSTDVISPAPDTPIEVTSYTDGLRDQARALFVSRLRKRIIQLLLNDLGSILLSTQSTCDAWINTLAPLMTQDFRQGRDSQVSREPDTFFDSTPHASVSETTIQMANTPDQAVNVELTSSPTFDLELSYACIIKDISSLMTPTGKLTRLIELVHLVALDNGKVSVVSRPDSSHQADPLPSDGSLQFRRYSNIARTRLDRMQVIIANCQDRLDNCMVHLQSRNMPPAERLIVAARRTGELLTDDKYRAQNLYSDFQIMATYLDAPVLDQSVEGCLFWIVGLSILNFKARLCSEVVGYAHNIVDYHLNHARRTETLHSSNTDTLKRQELLSPTTDLSKTSLTDAAQLFTIAALEGEPKAAFELGIFHLTHPELVDRVIQPFSRPNEVFKAVVNPSGKSESRTERAPAMSLAQDPLTLMTAFHWMRIAAGAGNTDARNFLTENGDLSWPT